MSVKYRVKLENNRIVGPFSAGQVAELFERGHITDASDCQEFPAGDWKKIDDFAEVKTAIVKRLSGSAQSEQTHQDATIVNMMVPKKKVNKQLQEKLSETPVESLENEVEKEKLSEFKFEIKDGSGVVDYDELEKKYQAKQQEKSARTEEQVKPTPAPTQSDVPSLEKTRVYKRPTQPSANQDATRVIRPKDMKPAAPDRDTLKEKITEKAEQIKEETPAEEIIDTDEATQFINVGSMIPKLHETANQAEKDIITLAKQKNEDVVIEPEDLERGDDEEEEEKPKKQMKPIVLIAFIVIFWFIFFDEDDKAPPPIAPQRISLVFPAQGEFLDEVKAQQALVQGLDLISKQNYLSTVAASKAFRVSLFHKFQNNPAMGHLMMTYAQLYPNAKNKLEASTTLFNLVRVSQDKILTDANMTIGSAIFYINAEKYLTAVNIIENYLRVSKKPTVTMLSVYLDALVKAGKLSESKEVFERIVKLDALPISAYVNMASYLELDERIQEAKTTVEKGLAVYPDSVELLLKQADYQLRIADKTGYEETLKKVERLRAEQCPIYYASFLEHMGNASVLQGQFDQAAKFYRESLAISESPQLRTRLANLSVGGSSASQALIKESKIHELMKKSRFAMSALDWESAFVYAIEAADMNPLYIQSNLLLVEIQIKRGYYSAALTTLQRLKKEYPTQQQINARLVEAYISAFRFNDAITTINEYAQVEEAVNTPIYASMLGRYYYANNNDLLAIKWFTEAVNRNPLLDNELYLMAKIYVKNGKYQDGKLMLTRALTLDPVNLNYQILYAQILYDQDGADTAIGYIRDLLKTNQDNPQLLGEIAKYYYKSGQIKEFNLYRERVEKQATKDENFYRFMIYASELNQKADKVIEYARELVKINPGDVVTFMKMGEYLAKEGRYQESLEAFEQVKERLDNYPRINYMIAKTYVEMKNFDKAYEYAELEIKGNPKIPQGYYIAGHVLAKRGEFLPAIKQLEKAVTIDFGYVEALIELANLKRRQNSHEQARELLLRALKGEPNNPLVHRELGHVYRAVGQGALAAESFQTYLTLLPSANDRDEIEAYIRASR